MGRLQVVKDLGLTGPNLIATWVNRHIQQLQAKVRPMWCHSGADDPTQVSPKKYMDTHYGNWMDNLTEGKFRREVLVPVFGANNQPPL